jgi:hypothetical protein
VLEGLELAQRGGGGTARGDDTEGTDGRPAGG